MMMRRRRRRRIKKEEMSTMMMGWWWWWWLKRRGCQPQSTSCNPHLAFDPLEIALTLPASNGHHHHHHRCNHYQCYHQSSPMSPFVTKYKFWVRILFSLYFLVLYVPMFHNIVSLLLPVFYLANNPFLCPFCHQIIELVYFHQIPRHCVPGAPCVLPSATVLITQFGAAAGRQSSPCIEELQNLKMMAT